MKITKKVVAENLPTSMKVSDLREILHHDIPDEAKIHFRMRLGDPRDPRESDSLTIEIVLP